MGLTMRWFSFLAALIVGVNSLAALSIAQNPTIIINKRTCVDGSANAPAPKTKCPPVTAAEESACPTGPCYGYQNDGCEYYQQPTKASQRIFKNDGEETTPIDITSGEGKKPMELSRTICYKERQCIYDETSPQVYECAARVFKDYVLIKWDVTNKPCIVAINP